MSERLASGPQLWRLNQAGRIVVVDEPGTPLNATTASNLVSTLAICDAFEVVELDDTARRVPTQDAA
jgi:hypothetical protein